MTATEQTAEHLRMTAAESRLCEAAREFGDARLLVDRHEGEKSGPEFTDKVKAWHRTNIALQSAARAYATAERNRT